MNCKFLNFSSKKITLLGSAIALSLSFVSTAEAATLGFADVVLDYFDSGAGPIPGPYGGETPGGIGFPVSVSTDVVLGDDPSSPVDFLSLPTDSFVTVGFTDETVIDGDGNDIFIQEVGAAGELADVFVSSDLTNFTFLGTANDASTTSFDLASIGFTDPVQAIQIVGQDSLGASPGFDVVNVQVLPGSIGEPPTPDPNPNPDPDTPTPATTPEPISVLGLLSIGLVGFYTRAKK